jgi:hypothetical protein
MASVLKSGIGWFQIKEHGTTGGVSAPFPVLIMLMGWCKDAQVLKYCCCSESYGARVLANESNGVCFGLGGVIATYREYRDLEECSYGGRF